MPEARFYSLGGVPSRDILKVLSAEQGMPLDPLAVAREKEAEYSPDRPGGANQHGGRNRPGALWPDTVGCGLRRDQEDYRASARSPGHPALFQAIVTSEDVANQKPAPEIFLEAARRLAVPPQSCRAYEDTDLGMQAIRAAGMEAVDVRQLLVKRET